MWWQQVKLPCPVRLISACQGTAGAVSDVLNACSMECKISSWHGRSSAFCQEILVHFPANWAIALSTLWIGLQIYILNRETICRVFNSGGRSKICLVNWEIFLEASRLIKPWQRMLEFDRTWNRTWILCLRPSHMKKPEKKPANPGKEKKTPAETTAIALEASWQTISKCSHEAAKAEKGAQE